MNNKLIILDRDGVINHDSDDYIRSENDWRPITGSAEAIARLNNAGYKVVVATNQSGLSRGYFDAAALQRIHNKMSRYLGQYGAQLAQIEFCADHPDHAGPNRKPNPGMAQKLLKTFNANPDDTWFVGDSFSDVQCALNAGCRPALVLTGKGVLTQTKPEFKSLQIPVFEDLAQFVEQLLTNP